MRVNKWFLDSKIKTTITQLVDTKKYNFWSIKLDSKIHIHPIECILVNVSAKLKEKSTRKQFTPLPNKVGDYITPHILKKPSLLGFLF